MSEIFENVSINKAANSYFNGNVTSRTITFEDGSTKTLGIMLPGEYEFSTQLPELMEITEGDVEILLPNEAEWTKITNGQSFNVIGDASFKIKVHQVTDYICTFISEGE